MDSSLAHMISWSEATKGDIPVPLTGPSVTISPLPSPSPPKVFLYGGKQVHDRRLSDIMWEMDLTTKVWSRLDCPGGPGPRYFHSMDIWEDNLVLFGGMSDADSSAVHNDIWLFDCASRQWLERPIQTTQDENLIPSPRYAHLSAISRGQLVISGGQNSDNSWIYEVNVYDLRERRWISKTQQPEMGGMHSKGAYRSITASSRHRVVDPGLSGDAKLASSHSYIIDEEGEGGDIWCYSNYDFAKVRRELDIFSPVDPDAQPVTPSAKHASPPTFSIRDVSARMRGPSQPPGLRFPTGGIVGNHFILCGLYLASTSAAFSVWVLNLETLTWRHLEPSVLTSGSWNRAIVWPEQARILVFGNSNYDLAQDYGRRAVNLDHVAVIQLETFGIYEPPRLEVAVRAQEIGLNSLDKEVASDFEVICEDGRKIKCAKRILLERWPWFAEQDKEITDSSMEIAHEIVSVDINDTLLGSFDSTALAPTQITIPEPFPVCVAFVQYLYTLNLSTQLQNRAPVLSALLFLAKQYKLDRLARLVVHALHRRLDASNAVGVYEIAALSGELNLQVRALQLIHVIQQHWRDHPADRQSTKGGSGSRSARQGPQTATTEGALPTGTPQRSGATQAPSQESVNGDEPVSSSVGSEGQYRRARVDSMTLPTHRINDDPAGQPLAASSSKPQIEPRSPKRSTSVRMNSPIAPSLERRRSVTTPERPERPRRPAVSPTSVPMQRFPPMPPTPDLTVPEQDYFRRGSYSTSSDGSSLYLATPRTDPSRESGVLPRDFDPYPAFSKLAAGQLDTLPETLPMHQPPSAFRKTQSKPQDTGAQVETGHTSGGQTTKALSHERSGVSSSPVRPARRGLTDGSFTFNAYRTSSNTISSTESAAPTHASDNSKSFMHDFTTEGEVTVELGDSGLTASGLTPLLEPHQTLTSPSKSATVPMHSDAMSISSGSTSFTKATKSGKKMSKEEKKQAKLDAKEEKRRKTLEAARKYEAMAQEWEKKRGQQIAEIQRLAEIHIAKEGLPVEPRKKGALARFGDKFADAVTFPAGGQF